ncbi:hypothetical protein UFOVP1636_350 [uncultured Caudovirales phage]|uniref:Uncharacterized protein n=1 Tax=uncultured Caudovirales phage TaxID=2100421 RepID=A0A6J5T1G0_9CAUD|nr:hypothetical protein UFOVP1636_350 [uncultured Caudovirales phage]
MIKKRAMAYDRWITDMAEEWIAEIDMKRLETGYADNQPKWPYWVRPFNYDESEWQEMANWLVNTFGNSNWLQENALWVGSDRKYWFRNEQDRTLFLLKWS